MHGDGGDCLIGDEVNVGEDETVCVGGEMELALVCGLGGGSVDSEELRRTSLRVVEVVDVVVCVEGACAVNVEAQTRGVACVARCLGGASLWTFM